VQAQLRQGQTAHERRWRLWRKNDDECDFLPAGAGGCGESYPLAVAQNRDRRGSDSARDRGVRRHVEEEGHGVDGWWQRLGYQPGPGGVFLLLHRWIGQRVELLQPEG